jgi:transketolase
MNTERIEVLELIAKWVRSKVFQTILNADSGHLGGSSSSTELMVALYFGGILKYDPENPRNPHRDRVIVRGHLGPLRYSIFSLLGWVTDEELLTYRRLGSRLQGHESMEALPGVDITPSGMLGMGLSFGTGSAIASKNQSSPTTTTWVFLGDGEEQEGNVSEAARHIASIGLTNIVGIIDMNSKQLSQPTRNVDGASDIRKIWEGYGWYVEEINDGNSMKQVMESFAKPRKTDQPTLFIAKTIKGFGLGGAKDHFSGYHTLSTCPKEIVKEAIASLSLSSVETEYQLKPSVRKILDEIIRPLPSAEKRKYRLPEIDVSEKDIPEDALIEYLNKLTAYVGGDPDINLYVLTGDVTVPNLSRACGFHRPRVTFIDVGIREQHLLGVAHGIAVCDPNSLVLVMESDPFLFRAADQLNAISQAKSKIIIFGSDSGLCAARNGSTHQTTGQPGALICMSGLNFLEPADVADLKACLNFAVSCQGPVYIRLHDIAIAPLPADSAERNSIAYTAYKPTSRIRLVIVASGLVVGEAVKLAKSKDEDGLGIRVINAINLKELGRNLADRIVSNVPVFAVYNGNPDILQSAVAKAVMENSGGRPSTIQGHGYFLGTSGRLEELMKYFRLDAEGIGEEIKLRFPDLNQWF